MSLQIKESLSYDDVLLVPQYSDIESRSKIDISVKMGNSIFKHPIIPANMKTIMGEEMARVVINSGGLAILHRFMDEKDQLALCKKIILNYSNGGKHVAASIGVKAADKEMVVKFWECGIRIICIDIAHGDSKMCVEMTKWIRERYPEMFIIAGNVATGEGAKRLWLAGADAIKCGIGPGSLCSTRIETGNGVPQLSALMEVSEMKHKLENSLQYLDPDKKEYELHGPIYIIADGGIKTAGDIVKALCFSDMIMAGNLFASCEETPGTIIIIGDQACKEYAGSSTHKTNHIEGVAAIVPVKGTYNSVLTTLLEGLRSGISYQGAHNLTELKDNPVLVRITNAGLKESHPHIISR